MKKVEKTTIVFGLILSCLLLNFIVSNQSILTLYNYNLEKRDFLHSSASEVEIKSRENKT